VSDKQWFNTLHSDIEWLILPCVVLVALACLISNLVGLATGNEQIRHEAVASGHAEWVADTSGKPQFKWKECK